MLKEFLLMNKLYKRELEEIQAPYLASYAVKKPVENSRDHEEKSNNLETRTDFQRDKDRILHSKAFRRLMYKTQVFVNHENDDYRTRLTHSLEVAQMSRGIARSLRLNEDLVEAIALGHDLGHTPFGHAVEDLLNKNLRNYGGFYHNEQSIRVVELLETKTGAHYPGLNLTKEVREGILKHTKDTSGICAHLAPDSPPSLEAQVVRFADTIAYVSHDFEDAYYSSTILKENPLLDEKALDNIWELFNADKQYGVSSILNKLITDLTEGTAAKIMELNIQSVEDVRNHQEYIVGFKKYGSAFDQFRKFVNKYVYDSSITAIMDTKAKRIINELYNAYLENPKQLPTKIYVDFLKPRTLLHSYLATPEREICDFLSSLTDRQAILLYNKLFNHSERIINAN